MHSVTVMIITINFPVVTFMLNGTVVTVPYLLYHDEISLGTTTTSGSLTCTVRNNAAVWRDVSAAQVPQGSSPLESTSGLTSRLSRTGDPIPNVERYNGEWSCRDQGVNAFGHIGIYNRGGGKLTYTFSRLNKYI